jgi:nucleoid-associated protein YgaU
MKITRLHLLLLLIIVGLGGFYGIRYYQNLARIKEEQLRQQLRRAEELRQLTLQQQEAERQQRLREALLAREAVAVAGEYYQIARQQGKDISAGQPILRQAKDFLNNQQYDSARRLAHQAVDIFRTAPLAELKYSVKPGDSLWKISAMKRHYRRGFLWPIIYRANKEKIRNPRLIYPRQVFRIPKSNLKKYLTLREARRWQKYLEAIGGE